MHIVHLLVIGVVSIAVPLKAHASDRQASTEGSGTAFELASGTEYQEGKYGTGQKIETITVPISARIHPGRSNSARHCPMCVSMLQAMS